MKDGVSQRDRETINDLQNVNPIMSTRLLEMKRKSWQPKTTWQVAPTTPEWKQFKKGLSTVRYHRTPALPFFPQSMSWIVTGTTHFLKCARSLEPFLSLTSSVFCFLTQFLSHKHQAPLKTAHKYKLHFAMHNNLLHIEISFWDHLFRCLKLGPYSKCGSKFSSSGGKSKNAYTVSVKCRYCRHIHEH